MSLSPENPVVYLIDVDNTLLDNDRFGAALGDHLDYNFGAAERARYWTVFSERRERLGVADYLGSLEVFREGLEDHPRLLQLSEFLLDYPFARLVYRHKEKMMDQVQHLFPAPHYVVVDDKPNLLAAIKAALGARITTVFVRQGHYAHDVQSQTQTSSPDLTIERIGELMSFNPSDLQVRP